ncbi:IreB family regulatory phosphoprotein [Erysipelotrichaceae bacterium OttesenSCG-928-M19]|nr:IreB family regulatory phosphoprotein [Erysipelotrichaceae bacterium OttesenSCG-928-M19]
MDNNNTQHTMLFDANEIQDQRVRSILEHVVKALEEKGYNAINQIVGYLISNDPAYISSHDGARKVIQKVTRDEIIEELVKSYLEKNND